MQRESGGKAADNRRRKKAHNEESVYVKYGNFAQRIRILAKLNKNADREYGDW